MRGLFVFGKGTEVGTMKRKSGWVLLAGCVTLLMAGVIYAWSVLKRR